MGRVILKDFTGGVNRATDATKMKDNEFYNFQNLIIYKLGSIGNAVKRAGLEIWNTRSLADVDTNQQVFQYISNSKAVNFSRFIVKSTTKTKYITLAGDSAYTEIIPSGDVTGKVRFLVFRDNLYILNRNTSGTYQSNKFYDGTTCVDMGLIPANNGITLTPATAPAGVGTLENGNYKYLITFVYGGVQESYFLPNSTYGSAQATGNAIFVSTSGNSIFANASTAGTGKVMDLSNIPTGNARVTARRIYRTKVGGNQFYFLAEITNNTDTKFTDSTLDSALFDPIDLQAVFKPPIAKYGVFHKDRMFIANLKENLYSNSPLNDTIATADATSTLTPPMKVGSKFNYIFYYLYLYPTLNSGGTGLPFQGFLGAPSGIKTHTVGAGKDAIAISQITNLEEYSKLVLIERQTEQTITNYAVATNVVTLTMVESRDFNVGEKITVATSVSAINGTFTIVAIPGATTLTYNCTTGDVGTTATTGTVKSDYYYVGITALSGTAYTDGAGGALIFKNKGILEQNNIEKLTSDKTLPSTLQWSDVNYGDSFPPDNSIEIEANDNDIITGLISEDDGVLIFKERNIYKLYTDRESAYWMMRKVVSNVGCTEPYSIVTIGTNTHLFNSNGQIYLYQNGQVRKISEKIQPILDGFGTVSNIDVCFDSFRNWVVWTYQYTDSAVVTQDIIVLDLNFPQDNNIGSWYHFRHYSIGGDTPINDGLTVCSPLSAKDGSLLFGSTSNCLMQYGKTPQYKDTYHVSGTATDRIIDVKLLKYFDFDEWEIERFLGKFRLGGASSTTVSTSGKTTTKTTAGADTKVRVNTKTNTGKLQEEYIQVVMPSNVSFEIKEVGFDYLPKHEKRGSF